jgi:hypothetical protein
LLETLSLIQHRAEKVIIFCEFRAIQRLLKHYIEQAFGFSPDIINGDSKASTTRRRIAGKNALKRFRPKPDLAQLFCHRSPLVLASTFRRRIM